MTWQCRHAECANGHDDVRRECDQFRRVSAVAFNVAPAPSDVDLHIAALNPAQLLQRLLERHDPSLTLWIVRDVAHEHTDAPHPLGLLRTRGERPGGCGSAEKLDDLPSSHAPSQQQTIPGLREVLLNFRQ